MGYIHIYCGDGKGKTSAALGLAVRAAGRGKKILIMRFLKNEDSGEVAALQKIPGIVVIPCFREFGFVFQMNEKEKAEAAEYYQRQFEDTCQEAAGGEYDVLILDEIMAACNYGMVREGDVVNFLEHKPENLEVVLTGRNPSVRLWELADYISEIGMKRHPFQRGIGAREGIEY